ncbi:MAG: ABC transporter ATP-binding protein [Aerococcaceae bacterium]|nr:ABC transporter ATP-binding protein [Aerococcaceae bacterium]
MSKLKDLFDKCYKHNLMQPGITLFGGIGVVGLSVLISLLFEPFLNQFTHHMQIDYYLFVLLIALIVLKIFLSRFMIIYNMKVYFNYEKNLISRLLMKMDFFDGEVIEATGLESWLITLTNDVKQVARLASITVPDMLVGLVGFSVALVYGLTQVPLLTFVILMISITTFLILKRFSTEVANLKEDELNVNQRVQKVLLDFLDGVEIFRAFSTLGFGFEHTMGHLSNWRASRYSKQHAIIRLESFAMGSGFVMTAIWFSFAFYLIGIQKLSLGQYLGFAMLSDYLNWPFMEFPNLYSAYVEESVSQQRYNEYEAQLIKKDFYPKQYNTLVDEHTLLSVKDLSFTRNEATIIKNLNFEIKKGEKWLITGESGSGKSTLIKFLIGYYDNNQGELSWFSDEDGNQPLLAYIPQNIPLFCDTLEDNILLGRKTTQEVLNGIIEEVGLDTLVEKLPMGLQTPIATDGQILSQGEIQRIGIARALVKEADLIIADEPVSALDSILEQKILEKLIHASKALVLVSHRQIEDTSQFKILDMTAFNHDS